MFEDIMAGIRTAAPKAKIDGVVISPMREKGLELLVGIKRDKSWGPMLAVGCGGVLVELMADVATAPLPVTAEDVKGMLRRLRGAKLLQGFRGGRPVDMDALAKVVVKIADAAFTLGPRLESLEINPLIVGDGTIEALDALAVWEGVA